MHGICKLCQLEKELIGRSHIIPDFLYKHSGLYDNKHRIRHFSIEDLIKGRKPSLPQSGIHEGGILCAECDRERLGDNFEQYSKKAIYGGGYLPQDERPECLNYYNDKGQTFAVCKNLNYTKYKLFLLSSSLAVQHILKAIFQINKIGATRRNFA